MIERSCGEFLTVQEIKVRYPQQWVLLDNVQSDRGPTIRGGRVRFTASNPDDVYAKATELNLNHIAMIVTGPDDPNIRFVVGVQPVLPSEPA
jgi:hypothetical protein